MTKIGIKTYGCSSNFSDSEVMAGLLTDSGFEIVEDLADSYIVIINACTVKGDTNSLKHLRKLIEEFPYKRIIIAGCITKDLIEEARKIKEQISFISTHNIREIVSIVEETLNENYVELVEKPEEYDKKINFPKIRRNSLISIIPISNGCVSKCAYCSVRLIKGDLFSYPIESILDEAKKSIADGCKELWITSQDTAAYGIDQDGEQHLPELLIKLLDLEGNFMIRLGMGNPHLFIKIADELINIMKHKKMFKFLHIPVQSGNDEILLSMNRKYGVGEFIDLIERFRKANPYITISTDMICGYPEETDEQFKDSINLIDKIMPDALNISRFQARPNTAAAEMKQLTGEVIKNRSRQMTSHFHWTAFERNRVWKKWEGTILIDEKGKDSSWIGRNACYKQVIVNGNLKLGDIVNVKIIDITKHYLIGEII